METKKPSLKKCALPGCENKFPRDPFKPFKNWCCPDHAIKLAQYKKEKKEKKEIQDKKLELDADVYLQDEINAIVRLIDANQKCLARNYYPNQMHAGHVYARGGNKSIRYNLHNIHRQSAQSNGYQNDDGILKEGVVREYGQRYMDFISNLRSTPALKYQNYEYAAFVKKAREIKRRLKKASLTYTLKQRIQLRNEINLELGIYDKTYCVFE